LLRVPHSAPLQGWWASKETGQVLWRGKDGLIPDADSPKAPSTGGFQLGSVFYTNQQMMDSVLGYGDVVRRWQHVALSLLQTPCLQPAVQLGVAMHASRTDAPFHFPGLLQGNSVLDLGKQLAAAILNVQWYTRSKCALPSGSDLDIKKPAFSSIADAIEKGNGLLAQRRVPGGLCDCCTNGQSCAGTVCAGADGCDITKNLLATDDTYTNVLTFLQAWNAYKTCGDPDDCNGDGAANGRSCRDRGPGMWVATGANELDYKTNGGTFDDRWCDPRTSTDTGDLVVLAQLKTKTAASSKLTGNNDKLSLVTGNFPVLTDDAIKLYGASCACCALCLAQNMNLGCTGKGGGKGGGTQPMRVRGGAPGCLFATRLGGDLMLHKAHHLQASTVRAPCLVLPALCAVQVVEPARARRPGRVCVPPLVH
jgi:hypothetical protein